MNKVPSVPRLISVKESQIPSHLPSCTKAVRDLCSPHSLGKGSQFLHGVRPPGPLGSLTYR